ncbi:hypothetical protein Cgig2_031670 [Carnegiea gigantea]|uniref:Uncharacterized protein n=1 Tax=Carnegiea gigantea TaxID=171969 RepID=A0A9Q1QN48_9CARY|nr:hypothetical protein Cgig2_031670 [Carnegiea gigantea]
MSLAFPNLSWWLWSGKRKEGKLHNGSSLNSSNESNVLELDVLKFPVAGGNNVASDSRRVRRKWRSQEQGKIDKEYDVVLVPSDGGHFSDSESADDSDWSIGWSEPHAPGFLSEDEIDGGFGVLVPCYGRGRGHGGKRGGEKNRLGNVGSVSDYAAGKALLYAYFVSKSHRGYGRMHVNFPTPHFGSVDNKWIAGCTCIRHNMLLKSTKAESTWSNGFPLFKPAESTTRARLLIYFNHCSS